MDSRNRGERLLGLRIIGAVHPTWPDQFLGTHCSLIVEERREDGSYQRGCDERKNGGEESIARDN